MSLYFVLKVSEKLADTFNNREIAIGIWILILSIYVLRQNTIRKSLLGVFKALCNPRLVIPFIVMVGYLALSVLILKHIGFWETSLLKDTVLWIVFGASAMVAHVVSSRTEDEGILRKILTDNFRIIIIFEFIIGIYTFSLLGELVLIPVLTTVAALGAYASYNDEHASVHKLMNGILTVSGFAILYFSVQGAISDWQNLGTLDTLKSIALIPLLSLTFCPFLYLVSIYSIYERIFVNLKIGREKSRDVKRYAILRIIQFGRLNRMKLIQFSKEHSSELIWAATREDIDLLCKA